MIDKKATADFWYISYNETHKHHGHVPKDSYLSTSLGTYEEFDNEEDYLARCAELGIEISKEDI